MARVFVSYRRADGLYAVGWLAEQLRALDSITGVETAFHDAALRAGDDFHEALDAEIEGSDLVIAMIGPEWWGRNENGPARIEDPDDWVVREIATAFEHDTRVLPILVNGAEHPTGAEIHESIDPLARLHALPFNDGRDLATIVEHVESHLGEIDRARARIAGLEEPVWVPLLPRQRLLIGLSVLVAVVLVGLMWWANAVGVANADAACGGAARCVQDTTAFALLQATMVFFAVGAAVMAVVGAALALRIHRLAELDYPRIFASASAVAVALLLMTLASGSGHAAYADIPGLSVPWLRFVANTATAVVGASALTICLVAPVFSQPRAGRHLVGERVAFLAIARDAERWAAVTLAAMFTVITAGGALLMLALRQSDVDGLDLSPLPNIVFALMFSIILLIVHLWAMTKLRDLQATIVDDLADLPPRYRANAEPRLELRALDVDGWAFLMIVAMPLITAVVMGAVFSLV